MNEHPDRAKCYEMLKIYGTPEHVIGHCKAVAAVGVKLAQEINSSRERAMLKGGDGSIPARTLDERLILSAGLLHDMCRERARHEIVCADILNAINLDDEAQIIRVHMNYDDFKDVTEIDECDIVCLSDRMVIEDRYSGLNARMEYIIRKAEARGASDARQFILEKKAHIEKFTAQIESLTGKTIDDMMANLDYESPEKPKKATLQPGP